MYDANTRFQQKNYTDKCFQKTLQKSENKRKERDVKQTRKSYIPNNLVNLKKLIQKCLSEQLSETVKEFPVLYDKAAKRYKEKDAGKAATRGVLCKKVFLEI